MATPTQTTAAVKADNVGANPTIAAGLTFQSGRDVIVHVGHYTSGSNITNVSIGGTSGSRIGRRRYGTDPLYAEAWLIKNIGSSSSNIVFTVSGSGHYITIVGREFPASTFGSIDTAAEGGGEGSATSLTVNTAASISNASSVLVATFVGQTAANPYGFSGITGYSDVVEQEDNVNSQAILTGWLETTTTGTKSATATQASNFPWAGSLGVVALSSGSGSSGTLAKTNTNDTLSASGTTTIVGSLARTNANDTSTASGSPIVNGSLAVTNQNDTSSVSGSVGSPVSGTIAVTNSNDTSSATGTTTVTGSVIRTNSNDTSSAQGSTTIVGSLARTNSNDTLSASGSVGSAVGGTLAVTNQNDSISAQGSTTVTGIFSYTNNNDTVVASGTIIIVGTLAKTNNNDTLNATGFPGTPVVGSGTRLPLTGAGAS